MGACYSKNAGGGKYSYSTIQMASTKLEDTSRLARPTPYFRNNTVNSSAMKKGIPIPTGGNQQPVMNCRQNDSRAVKNTSPLPPQSSIPRFNSNTPTNSKHEINDNMVITSHNTNDNNDMHIMNNNLNANTPTSSKNLEFPRPYSGRKSMDKKGNKVNVTNKSGNVCGPAKEEKNSGPRSNLKPSTPTNTRSFLPHFKSKFSTPTPHPNEVRNDTSLNRSKHLSKNSKETIYKNGQNKSSEHISAKSPVVNSSSHDSITDSGLGVSIGEKHRAEDQDTLQDVDRLSYEDAAEDRTKRSDEKAVKCPTYKRSVNGKWTLDDKNLTALQKSDYTLPENSADERTPPRSPHKIPATGRSFTTYASYKGLMSYKKYSSKPRDIPGQKPVQKVPDSSPVANRIAEKKDGNMTDSSKSSCSVADSKMVSSSSSADSPTSSSKHSSHESGSDTKSPPSEVENREFLIDDEIADQPSLISINQVKMETSITSLQQSVTELHELQSMSGNARKNSSAHITRERLGSDHRDSLMMSFELGSSCSSIASDDLMLDFEKKTEFAEGNSFHEGFASPIMKHNLDITKNSPEKFLRSDSEERARKRINRRSSGSFVGGSGISKDEWRLRSVSLPLRPPRPLSVSEMDDGSIVLDSSSYRLLSQDLNGVKTLLLRLKSVIQEAETVNPFDHINTKNIFYSSLVNTDVPYNIMKSVDENTSEINNSAGLTLENADLRRQMVLLQQQLEDKNRTINLLQQQMSKYINNSYTSSEASPCVNAATQTERTRSLTGSLTSSLENSCETLVSFRITKCPGLY